MCSSERALKTGYVPKFLRKSKGAFLRNRDFSKLVVTLARTRAHRSRYFAGLLYKGMHTGARRERHYGPWEAEQKWVIKNSPRLILLRIV